MNYLQQHLPADEEFDEGHRLISEAILLFLVLLVFQKVWNRIKLRIHKKKNAKLCKNLEEWRANQHGEQLPR